MSAITRSSAHDTIVVAKITTAVHIAIIIAVYCDMPCSITTGAMSAPSVRSSPSARVMSAAVVSTDSLKLYLLVCGVGLAYSSITTLLAMPSGVGSLFSSASGRKALHDGQVFNSPSTSMLQLRHSHVSFSLFCMVIHSF